jgi:outer membrane protein assembly factor BamB
MRGKRMRCTTCREVFEVRDEAAAGPEADGGAGPAPEAPGAESPPPQVPAAGPPQAGSLGDLVPILPAEAADNDPWASETKWARPEPSLAPETPPREEVIPLLPAEIAYPFQPDLAPAEASWQQPPPVRGAPAKAPEARPSPPPEPREPRKKPARKTMTPPAAPEPAAPGAPATAKVKTSPDSVPAPPRTAADTMQAVPGGPIELPPGAWEAPPVRPRPTDAGPVAQPPEGPPPAAHEHPESLAPEHHDQDTIPVPVARRRARWLLAGLSVGAFAVIGLVLYIAWIKLIYTEENRYLHAKQEVENHRYRQAAGELKELAKDYPDSDNAPKYQSLEEMCRVLDVANQFPPQAPETFDTMPPFAKKAKDDPLLADYRAEFWKAFLKLVKDLLEGAERNHDRGWVDKARQALEQGRPFKPEGPSGEEEVQARAKDIDNAEAAIIKWDKVRAQLEVAARIEQEDCRAEKIDRWREEVKAQQLDQEPEIRAQLSHLEEALQKRITFTQAEARPASPTEAGYPTFVIVPALLKSDPRQPATDRTVFALVRGVVYALNQGTGEPRWATRVGIDMTTPPLRLASPGLPEELALVLSADTDTLTARNARTGAVKWQHKLSAPCLARPVLVDHRAFVPTYDGKVHVIDLDKGLLRGWYDLGQSLSVGGTRQEGTSLVYFPADQRRVFVLDVDEARRAKSPCVAVLQSGHPSGSLRGEPIVVSREVTRANAGGPNPWPDMLLLSQTDGLNGMKLRGFALPITNADGPPLLPGEEPRLQGWSWFQPYHDGEKLAQATDLGLLSVIGINQPRNLDRPLFVERQEPVGAPSAGAPSGRAQVVHAAEDNLYWVLALGRLLKLHCDPYGDKAVTLWEQTGLGSPLHDAQTDEAGKTLFVTTQALDRPTCLATAVDAETGKLLWQRQLGVLCRGEPLLLGSLVLMLDQGCSLFAFDPDRKSAALNGPWQVGGLALAGPLEGVTGEVSLLAGPDGRSAYAVACVDKGPNLKEGRYKLVLRRYEAGKEAAKDLVVDPWPAPPAGTPGAFADRLVVPMADGNLRRLPLSGEPANPGPTWRYLHADEGARGHVLALNADEFLTTDGSKTVMRWHWPAKEETWTRQATQALPARIVAAPMLVPRPNGEPVVCVADAEGNVTLLKAGDLKEVRRWPLPKLLGASALREGKVTAGPFLRGQRLGCVVDHRLLVWLDPDRDKPAWVYVSPGQGIVGRPQVVGDCVVVADLSGRFVGLDPATGEPRPEASYTLRESVAPAAGPVSFGPEQAFSPLTDGTVLLLPLKHRRQTAGRAVSTP